MGILEEKKESDLYTQVRKEVDTNGTRIRKNGS